MANEIKQSKKIIAIDDNEDIRSLMKTYFNKAGFHITVYSSGLTIMDPPFDHPDIFILDKQLPDIDGLEICRYLKKQILSKQIPVIMISAHLNIDTLSKEAGADTFLKKPFKMTELLQLVNKYVELGI